MPSLVARQCSPWLVGIVGANDPDGDDEMQFKERERELEIELGEIRSN